MTADTLTDKRRSPLRHLADQLAAVGSPQTVMLRELPFRTLIDIKGAATARFEQALGVPLPEQAGRATAGGSRQVLWLGPGWWLVVDGPQPHDLLEAPLVGALRDAAGGAASVVDASAQFTTLELTGQRARAVLEHGCSLDLHPRAFPTGSCGHTTLAKAPVVIHQTGEHEYRIVVRASFADYLARWLLDAMTEYVARPPGGTG
ncbi:MAG: sarcosine oxidase subunit gamma [Micromonosporaceae bacterium]